MLKISQARPPCSLGTSALGRPKVSWRRCETIRKTWRFCGKTWKIPIKPWKNGDFIGKSRKS